MISLVMMLILISLVHGNNVQCFVKMPTTINQDTALLAFASLGRRGIYTTIYTNAEEAEEAQHFHDFDDDRLDQIVKMISKTILLSEVMMNLMITGHLVLEYYHRPRQSIA